MNWANRTVFTGDNLDVLQGMDSGSADLIYAGPPHAIFCYTRPRPAASKTCCVISCVVHKLYPAAPALKEISMGLNQEIKLRREEIFSDGYPVSIGELINMYDNDELNIKPQFQRYFRWTDTQKSRLVESLLLGIPIPSIFVSQRKDGVWDVIDGLQRLSTIFSFRRDFKGRDRQAS